MDVKKNLAENLIKYRKAHRLTQAEFATKINYSDKAVSKWERAESVPDLAVLKEIADFYGVTIDSLIKKPAVGKIKPIFRYDKNVFYFLLRATAIMIVATLLYCFSSMILPSVAGKSWICYIYALPFVFIVFADFAKKRLNGLALFFFASGILWSIILSVYLSLILFLKTVNDTIWLTFVIGVPFEIMLIFLFFYKKIEDRKKEKSQ